MRTVRSLVRSSVAVLATITCTLLDGAPLGAQAMPGGVCRPVSERADGPTGCWILTHVSVDVPTDTAWWYVDVFADSVSAARARLKNSTVLSALGRVYRLTIGDAAGPVADGERIARVGPLPVTKAQRYMAQYMEATFLPGMASTSHYHSGLEAIITFTGETCAETPQGVVIGRGGGAPLIVPPETPMHVIATGQEIRRSLVLILHDASRPASTMKREYVPTGLCARTR